MTACVLLLLASAAHAAPRLVIEDNDFWGPGGSNIQSILPLVAAPDIEILGFTVVTGDGWVREETQALLRVLELGGLQRIPVAPGAVMPLVQTPARMALWERSFGKIPWKGAWNPASMGPAFHPDDPSLVPPMPMGPPETKPADERAAEFLVRQVRAHPHEVTILAAGPLTNLALAQRLDPQFAALARELVFMGGLIDTNMSQVTGDANFNTDFNILFDPEAAHIVLTAPWPRIVVVGNVSNDTLMTREIAERFDAAGGLMARFMAMHPDVGLPLWDELAAAIVADPSLVTGSAEAWMDADIDHGVDYGHVHVWTDALRPHLGEARVSIVTAVDRARFVDGLVAAAARAR
jgi:inosine-uridine nucleoside N-ribohydrolase